MRRVVSIRTLYATHWMNKKVALGACAKTLNPYTIYGTIEPEAPNVSHIVYGLQMRFWRCLYDFWSHFGQSVYYMRHIEKAPRKIECAIRTLYARH